MVDAAIPLASSATPAVSGTETEVSVGSVGTTGAMLSAAAAPGVVGTLLLTLGGAALPVVSGTPEPGAVQDVSATVAKVSAATSNRRAATSASTSPSDPLDPTAFHHVGGSEVNR